MAQQRQQPRPQYKKWSHPNRPNTFILFPLLASKLCRWNRKVLRFGWCVTYTTYIDCALTSHSFQFHSISTVCIYFFSWFNSIVCFWLLSLFLLLILLLLLLLCHFPSFYSGRGEIYGKSERFIGFRAMGLFITFVFTSFLSYSYLCVRRFFFPVSFFTVLCALSASLLIVCMCVCSSLCLLSFENLLLFYYHFDKVSDNFSVLLLLLFRDL